MNADSAKENGFPVEQEICAPSFDGAEPDVIDNFFGLSFNLNRIEFRILRRPKCQVSVEGKLAATRCIRFGILGDPRLGNTDSDFLMCLRPAELQPARNLARGSLCALNEVILNESFRDLNEGNGSGNSPIVPPIRVDGGNLNHRAPVIDRYD